MHFVPKNGDSLKGPSDIFCDGFWRRHRIEGGQSQGENLVYLNQLLHAGMLVLDISQKCFSCFLSHINVVFGVAGFRRVLEMDPLNFLGLGMILWTKNVQILAWYVNYVRYKLKKPLFGMTFIWEIILVLMNVRPEFDDFTIRIFSLTWIRCLNNYNKDMKGKRSSIWIIDMTNGKMRNFVTKQLNLPFWKWRYSWASRSGLA